LLDADSFFSSELSVAPVSAPKYLLGLAACSIAFSILLLFPGDFYLNIAGYLFGSVVVVLLVGMFRRVDSERRQRPTYSPQRGLAGAVTSLILFGLLVAMTHAWFIATELSKQ